MSVELLAPAGDFQTALSAFAAGADAVYCGLADYSARAFAKNLSFDELSDLTRFARTRGKKVYVAFNTVIDERDVEKAVETLSRIAAARPDALILQDVGVARICRRHFPELELHASTQLVAHNLEGVLALGKMGFKRVVLARELSLGEISSIVKRAGGIEIEVFIHGALCYSISGLCLFSAMEKGRSGNRGKCAYCCRLARECDGGDRTLPYSMRDLRLSEDVLKLVDAGVASLKIEGRMKSDIYVASATSYYRGILDGGDKKVGVDDLETVFSRRTTKLYFDSDRDSDRAVEDAIDPDSLGHLGAFAGSVKRIAKDREGLMWLRFHALRALERHDGLQFDAFDANGKRLGMGIGEMRRAISRRNVFSVEAGADVEVLLPSDGLLASRLSPGTGIYCSASQAVKRMFPPQAFRKSDFPGDLAIDVTVEMEPSRMGASTVLNGRKCEVSVPCSLVTAKNPALTRESLIESFSKMGDTDYRLGSLEISTGGDLFAPKSLANVLRRDLVKAIDEAREDFRRERVTAALGDLIIPGLGAETEYAQERPVLKVRNGMKIPSGDWREVVLSLQIGEDLPALPEGLPVRLALPVYTSEFDFPRLRAMVKNLVRQGFLKWEAADLATLSLLKSSGVEDITADWTLYAFNAFALAELSEMGVRRFVASPENFPENLRALAESGYQVEFLAQQSTPLFISLTPPAAAPDDLALYRLGRLWVTARNVPRTFDVPRGSPKRIDLSWDAPC